MDPVVLAFAQLTVFTLPFLFGLLVGWVHPVAQLGPWTRTWALLVALYWALAFGAALLGAGAVSWLLWVACWALPAVLLVRGAVLRGRIRRSVARFTAAADR